MTATRRKAAGWGIVCGLACGLNAWASGTWTGGAGADDRWSAAANWVGGTKPGNPDTGTVIFDHRDVGILQVDCEATQHALRNPALGARAVRGLGDIMADTGMKATFCVIPSDMRVHARLYRRLRAQGHEIGLHVHPADQGYQEFLGVYGADEQARIVREAMDVFAQEMGRPPECFTPGYGSANDHTFPVLEALQGIIRAARDICRDAGSRLLAATTGDIARQYRRRVPRPQGGVALQLDTRGRSVSGKRKGTK